MINFEAVLYKILLNGSRHWMRQINCDTTLLGRSLDIAIRCIDNMLEWLILTNKGIVLGCIGGNYRLRQLGESIEIRCLANHCMREQKMTHVNSNFYGATWYRFDTI